MKKKLAVGGDVFADMIRNNCYYVDKTPFIRTVMASEGKVLFMTRPRRFGKTLFMDTLKTFLQVNPASPGDCTGIAPLFDGLKIREDDGILPTVHGTVSDDLSVPEKCGRPDL